MEVCENNRFSSENSHLRPPRTTACTVCMDTLSDGSRVTRLPCHHCFHRGCIKQWLLRNKTCPICRRAVPTPVKKPRLRVTGSGQVGVGHIRVSHVDYRPPRVLWVYQLMELVEALFFNRRSIAYTNGWGL